MRLRPASPASGSESVPGYVHYRLTSLVSQPSMSKIPVFSTPRFVPPQQITRSSWRYGRYRTMSFFRFSHSSGSKSRDVKAADNGRPTLKLHVPAFGGIVMKPILVTPEGPVADPTVLAGQLEIHVPGKNGIMCSGLSVWLEGRWTDVEGKKDKGTSVCFEQKAAVDCPDQGRIRLRPGSQRWVALMPHESVLTVSDSGSK